VFPLELETAARRRSTCGAGPAGIRQLEGMGPKRFTRSVDDDTEFRSQLEIIIDLPIGFPINNIISHNVSEQIFLYSA